MFGEVNIGPVPIFQMHQVGIMPMFKMHSVGTVSMFKMFFIGTVPIIKMHHKSGLHNIGVLGGAHWALM